MRAPTFHLPMSPLCTPCLSVPPPRRQQTTSDRRSALLTVCLFTPLRRQKLVVLRTPVHKCACGGLCLLPSRARSVIQWEAREKREWEQRVLERQVTGREEQSAAVYREAVPFLF